MTLDNPNVGRQKWWDIPLFCNMFAMIAAALQDALVNTVKRANVSRYKPSGIKMAITDPTDVFNNQQAVLQSDWLDPRVTKFHWKEVAKWTFTNTSNLVVYLTINRKRLRRSHDSAIVNFPQTLLETFPVSYTWTDIGGVFLEFTPPNDIDQTDTTTIPAGGSSAVFYNPRRLGAWTERFPYEPRPSFMQARPENLFNIGAAQAQSVGGNWTDQEAATGPWTNIVFNAVQFNGGGLTYQPMLGTNYFANRINQAQTSGGLFRGSNAYTGMNFNTDDVSDQASNQKQYLDASTSTTLPTPNYAAGNDWSTGKFYKEKRNKMLLKLFRMTERRYTVRPGTVLRIKFTSKRHCLSGTTLMRIKNMVTPWSGLTGSSGASTQNIGRTLENWGYGTLLPQHGGKASGYQEEWVSVAMRGPHLPDSTTSNSINTAPAQLTLKMDHTVYTRLVAKAGKYPGKHQSIRDVLLVPSASNQRIMYPNPTTVSGTATAGTSTQVPQSARPY